MPPKSIRSTAQRQILTWLRHGPSTVSEIARRFGMRMPHASLACRQLREAGFVSRDERGGLRNAPIYLSSDGQQRLRDDAVGKMLHYAGALTEQPSNLVLHADDTNVLLAYTEPPRSSFVFVTDASLPGETSSSGNTGGVWILAPTTQIQWYDLNDGSPVPPPAPGIASTLESFDASQQRVGLVRGEIFERLGTGTLVEGTSFRLPSPEDVQPPERLRQGDVVLGTASGAAYPYAPPHGVHLHLQSTLNRSLALQSLGRDVVELSDRLMMRNRRLPLSVLLRWLKRKHPRMNQARLVEVHSALVRSLTEIDSSAPTPLSRSVLMEFGDVEWSHDVVDVGYLDVYGMSERAVHAVVDHLLYDSSAPFVLDWMFERFDDRAMAQILTHPQCRALVTRRGPPSRPNEGRTTLTDGSDMGTVNVHLGRSTVFSVVLATDQDRSLSGPSSVSSMPANAAELMTQRRPVTSSFSDALPPGEQGQRWRQALQLYPTGDEERANGWESVDPLASWIASPDSQRPSRWIRLHGRLPTGWVELMAADAVPIADLPLAMAHADAAWQRRALHRLQAHARSEPAVLPMWRQRMREDRPEAPSFAASLLCSLDGANPEHAAAIDEATSVWLDRPVCEVQVLESVFGRADQTDVEERLELWTRIALASPPGSLLHAWAAGLEIVKRREPWPLDVQRSTMKALPARWWSSFAGQWLVAQLATHSGRVWLEEFRCAWPAQLARPVGERIAYPGVQGQHAGFTQDVDSLMAVNLLNDGAGTPFLRDLYDMVYAMENDLPVPSLRTHPFAGWLVHPVEHWPTFEPEVMAIGDADIGALLYGRSFNAGVLPTLR